MYTALFPLKINLNHEIHINACITELYIRRLNRICKFALGQCWFFWGNPTLYQFSLNSVGWRHIRSVDCRSLESNISNDVGERTSLFKNLCWIQKCLGGRLFAGIIHADIWTGFIYLSEWVITLIKHWFVLLIFCLSSRSSCNKPFFWDSLIFFSKFEKKVFFANSMSDLKVVNVV